MCLIAAGRGCLLRCYNKNREAARIKPKKKILDFLLDKLKMAYFLARAPVPVAYLRLIVGYLPGGH